MALSGVGVPTVHLGASLQAPALAYGTGTAWFNKKEEAGENEALVASVAAAINLGFRHIDCAEVPRPLCARLAATCMAGAVRCCQNRPRAPLRRSTGLPPCQGRHSKGIPREGRGYASRGQTDRGSVPVCTAEEALRLPVPVLLRSGCVPCPALHRRCTRTSGTWG